MRDRVERIMREGLACDCCSAEIKALFTEWIENRECTLKTNVTEVESRANSFALPRCSNVTEGKEIADRLIPLMEKCFLFSADAIEEPPALLHICK
ncbi:MAG: hypothetical protein J6V98_05805 [Bacteroidales bacterium]|nr:hypothetical protein [Bacteroidales bacterium]